MGGVRYDPGGGGPPPVTSFADTLIGSDRPFYMGNTWYCVNGPTSTVPGTRQGADLNIGGSGLTFGDGSGNNDNGLTVVCFPAPVDVSAIVAGSLARGLFAQWTLVARPQAGVGCGPCLAVGCNPGGDGGYGLRLQSTNTNSQLIRGYGVSGANAVVQLAANVYTNNLGDVMRLEVSFGGASNTIRSFQNGILRDTTVDNNILRPASGLYGLALIGSFTGQVTISNFSGGLL